LEKEMEKWAKRFSGMTQITNGFETGKKKISC
jgi:hypothetical protein